MEGLNNMKIELFVPLSGIVSLLFAIFLSIRVIKERPGNEIMQGISKMIEKGAMAFLKREYSVLIFFIILVSVILTVVRGYITGVTFIIEKRVGGSWVTSGTFV